LATATYATVRSDLIADQTTADDITSATSIGGSDPTPAGSSFAVARAEAKAIGLIGASASNDGVFKFGQGFTYAYDPANRAVAGSFDFIGVATHEITEIMGRIALLGDTLGGATPFYAPMDLFRWTGPGSRTLIGGGASVTNANLSINAGANLLKLW